MTPTQNDIEKKQLIYFLEKYKKRMTETVKYNQESIQNQKNKLNKYSPKNISHKKAYKITSKVSESQRNVDYYKKEFYIVDKALDDIAHNRDTYEVNQAKARNELDHIKNEVRSLLGWTILVYIILIIATIFSPMLKSLLPILMTLITVVFAANYDIKCKQYNALQQNEDKKIDDTLIANGRPSIFKWFGIALVLALIGMCIVTFIMGSYNLF
jgi:uncharacterized membrane protein